MHRELPGMWDRPQPDLHEGQALAGLPGRAAQRVEGVCSDNKAALAGSYTCPKLQDSGLGCLALRERGSAGLDNGIADQLPACAGAPARALRQSGGTVLVRICACCANLCALLAGSAAARPFMGSVHG